MRVAAMLLGLLALVAVAPLRAAPVEGRDYVRLPQVQPTSDPHRIVITEFFSYECPHCYAFSKPFAAWTRSLPPDVLVERVSVSVGHAQWEPAARAFLVLGDMKLLPKLDDALFDAIHRQGLRLDSEQALAQWVGTQGGDAQQFTTLYHSFGVETRFKSAELKSRDYRVPGIPAIAIDGRYLVSIEDNGDFLSQLQNVNELILKARRERGAK